MIEKTAWDVRKYPEKFAVYRILCNFAVVFQNCINSMEAKYIHRELSAVIEEAYRYFSVITVTGPRQSGKTTLLRNLFSYLPYYSLENLDVRSFAENDPVAFLNQHTEGMILDEVHNAPNLLSYIQGMVDNDADRRFILSGSSQFAMLKKVTQSLAGRTAVFELLPLSYSEIREQITDTPLDNLLFNGFYPAIYSGRNIPKFLYPAYMKTYLDKDVRDLLQIKDMMQFHTFIRLCAGRIGSLFKASELANEIGVSSHTVTAWLSVLQASYIVFLLPPYFENTRKRLTKTPKLYFTDTGLACHLLGIESPFFVAIGRPAHTVQFIQNAKFLIEKRRLRQHVLALQVSTYTRHPRDEFLGTRALVDNIFPVPGRNRHTFGPRLAFGPREAKLSMCVLTRIALRKRPHIIRDAEGDQRQ